METPFHEDALSSWIELEPGVSRKIIGHTPHLLAAVVSFAKDAIGTPHSHPEYEQITYVLAGSFAVEVAGETRILHPGDAFVANKNVRHGVTALEENSQLLDIFSPRRDEFIAED